MSEKIVIKGPMRFNFTVGPENESDCKHVIKRRLDTYNKRRGFEYEISDRSPQDPPDVYSVYTSPKTFGKLLSELKYLRIRDITIQ